MTKKQDQSLKIGKFDETEKWMKDNPMILLGYRLNCCSCGKSVGSICAWHNETINIWTHLLGSLVMLFLLIVNLLR
jgi:adiponectin receptor